MNTCLCAIMVCECCFRDGKLAFFIYPAGVGNRHFRNKTFANPWVLPGGMVTGRIECITDLGVKFSWQRFRLNFFASYFISYTKRIIIHYSFEIARSFTLYCLI